MTTYSYSRWDGSQDWSDMDEDDFLQALSEDILTHGDVNRALRNLFQRGMSDEQGERVEGLREMMERLRQQRQAQLERYNVDSLMEDLKERLQDVLETERSGIDKRMSEAREQMEAAGDDSEHLKGPMEMLEDRRSGAARGWTRCRRVRAGRFGSFSSTTSWTRRRGRSSTSCWTC